MPLKVIGAGFGRTGTLSLKFALEQLGFGPCYHMMEVFKQDAVDDWDQLFSGAEPEWEKIFSGYASTVDWPSTAVWRELADAYPDAKVILTVRDPAAWWESTQATIFSRFSETPLNPFEVMGLKMVSRNFEPRVRDRDHMINVFKQHIETVRASLPPERLLIYDVAEGWGPLCRFLGVAIPEGPLPKVNSRDEFQARLAAGSASAATAH